MRNVMETQFHYENVPCAKPKQSKEDDNNSQIFINVRSKKYLSDVFDKTRVKVLTRTVLKTEAGIAYSVSHLCHRLHNRGIVVRFLCQSAKTGSGVHPAYYSRCTAGCLSVSWSSSFTSTQRQRGVTPLPLHLHGVHRDSFMSTMLQRWMFPWTSAGDGTL